MDGSKVQTRENPKRMLQCTLLLMIAGAVWNDEITASGQFKPGHYFSRREMQDETIHMQTTIDGLGHSLV